MLQFYAEITQILRNLRNRYALLRRLRSVTHRYADGNLLMLRPKDTLTASGRVHPCSLKPVVTLSSPRHRGAGAEDSSTTPVEPESARQLGGNSGGPPCSHGADARGGTASPFVPHDAVTTPGADPTVRTRSPAGPRGRHVTPPPAAQRPAGPRAPSARRPCGAASRGPRASAPRPAAMKES